MTSDMTPVQEGLRAIVIEAMTLRAEASFPPAGADTHTLWTSLQDTRQRLDRVEELLVQVLRIHGRAHRHGLSSAATAKEAWSRAVRAIATAPSIRGPEFQGPRERYAEADLVTLEDQRAALAAELLVAEAVEAREVLRTLHRGLDGLRQDHVTALRAFQFATSLEH